MDAAKPESTDIQSPLPIEAAKHDTLIYLAKIQRDYGLPNWSMELILSSCLNDIRQNVIRDLVLEFAKRNDKEPNYAKGVVLASEKDIPEKGGS